MDSTIGIAGYGLIGREYARLLKEQFGITHLRVADPRIANLPKEELLALEGIATFDDYRHLEGCDFVVVALPTGMHLEAMQHFAGRTKAMLIEKPLGATYHESRLVLEALRGKTTRTMCGLTGLFHPEFAAMYSVLPRLGGITKVHEKLHEAAGHLGSKYLKDCGVLTVNGIHTMHRFWKIASIVSPGEFLRVNQVLFDWNQFHAHGEDRAHGSLRAHNAMYEFDIAFLKEKTDTGLPIDYHVTITGRKGEIRVVGWERCESTINGTTEVHYAHPGGPLGFESHYPRTRIGLAAQIGEFLRFASVNDDNPLHLTMLEATAGQKLIEDCHRFRAQR